MAHIFQLLYESDVYNINFVLVQRTLAWKMLENLKEHQQVFFSPGQKHKCKKLNQSTHHKLISEDYWIFLIMRHSFLGTRISQHSQCGPKFGHYPTYSATRSIVLDFGVTCLLPFMIWTFSCFFFGAFLSKVSKLLHRKKLMTTEFSENLLRTVTVM